MDCTAPWGVEVVALSHVRCETASWNCAERVKASQKDRALFDCSESHNANNARCRSSPKGQRVRDPTRAAESLSWGSLHDISAGGMQSCAGAPAQQQVRE